MAEEKLSAHNTHITFGLSDFPSPHGPRVNFSSRTRRIFVDFFSSPRDSLSALPSTFNCDFSMNLSTLYFDFFSHNSLPRAFSNAIRLDMGKLKMRISQQITFLPAEEVARCGLAAEVMFQPVDSTLAKDFYWVTALSQRPPRFFPQHNSCLLSFSPQLFSVFLAFVRLHK